MATQLSGRDDFGWWRGSVSAQPTPLTTSSYCAGSEKGPRTRSEAKAPKGKSARMKGARERSRREGGGAKIVSPTQSLSKFVRGSKVGGVVSSALMRGGEGIWGTQKDGWTRMHTVITGLADLSVRLWSRCQDG